jgi:ADP-heptose:LPS heptosyltransferase
MAFNPLKRLVRSIFNFTISGRFFRRLAPQSPPAAPGGRRQLAIVDLIPNLGDKVMMFPIIDALHRENPDLEISYFTAGAGRLIASHPGIDHLYTVEDRPANGRPFRDPIFFLIVLRWWNQKLRDLRFHTVVVLRGGVEPWFSHHLAWLLGGDRRVAYSTRLEPERSEREYGVSPLFTDEVKEIRGVHEVSRAAEVLQLAGLLRHGIDVKQPVDSLVAIARGAASQSYLEELNLSGRPYAVVAPGAAAARRMWPAQNFAEVFQADPVRRGWPLVIVGGPEMANVARRIRDSVAGEILDLTGKTSFEQLVAVCGGAQCFLGNDSGTSHVAGACGTPTLIVTAFAHSGEPSHHASPKRSHPVGPWVAVVQPEHQLLPCTTECVATGVHCIGLVTVDEVARALHGLLEESGRVKPMVHSASGVSA